MAQTWNDVLEYVKINLGVPVNVLEIDDEDIIRLLKNQVLPLFSQYVPRKRFKALRIMDAVTPSDDGQPMYKFKIPLDVDEYVIDIRDVYTSNEPHIFDAYGHRVMTSTDITEVAMANTFTDILKSMSTKQSWEFLPPDVLIFDKKIRHGIVEYYTVHQTLATIEPDKYHIYFKKLCLANVKLWLSAMRSKFEQLNTPAAQLSLNWEKLQSEGNQEKEDVLQGLNLLPTEFLIYID